MESTLVARDTAGQPFSEKVIQGNALTMLLAAFTVMVDGLRVRVKRRSPAPT